jgi:hypothetical protein
MSEENVEVARQIFPGTIDMVPLFDDPALLAAMREGFERFVEPDMVTIGEPNTIPMGDFDAGLKSGPAGSIANGIDGFLNFWREWLSAWETWVLGPPEYIDVDENRVLLVYAVRARSKTHQVEMAIEGGNLLSFREGKLTRLELFFDRAEALKAAGLSG